MSEWISVDERMPGIGEIVMIAFEGFPTVVTAFIDSEYGEWMPYTDHISWNGDAHIRAFDDGDSPTHWMPLPEPPQ